MSDIEFTAFVKVENSIDSIFENYKIAYDGNSLSIKSSPSLTCFVPLSENYDDYCKEYNHSKILLSK